MPPGPRPETPSRVTADPRVCVWPPHPDPDPTHRSSTAGRQGPAASRRPSQPTCGSPRGVVAGRELPKRSVARPRKRRRACVSSFCRPCRRRCPARRGRGGPSCRTVHRRSGPAGPGKECPESLTERREERNLTRPMGRHAQLTLAVCGLRRRGAQRQSTRRSRLPGTEESLDQTIEWGCCPGRLTPPAVPWSRGRFCCLLVVSPLMPKERGRSPWIRAS